MSKTTQENPAVENSAEENVSNTSKAASTTRKTAGTTSKAASTTPKTTRTRATTRSPKSTASSTSTKAAPAKTTKPSVQQDKTMSQNTVRRVAIIGGNRIPFARSNGAYFTASNIDMFTAALNGLVERFNLQGQRLGEVVAGAVLKHSRDFNMTRECVLNTQLAPETPACDLQQACGTGLQAAFQVANKIALGQIEVGIAGGVDTTSDAPIAFGDGLRKALLELNIAKTGKDRLKALSKINVKDLMDAPKNGEPRTGLSMGDHQAITALEWGIAREDQDALAASSHQKMAKAYEEGFFDDLITPFLGLNRDNNLRADSTAEKLAKKGRLVLRDKEGLALAVMIIGDIWKPDRKKEAEQVYGTTDETHPGVNYLVHESNPIYIGGSVEGVHVPKHYDYPVSYTHLTLPTTPYV